MAVYTKTYKPLTEQELSEIINAKHILSVKKEILTNAQTQVSNVENLNILYHDLKCLRDDITKQTGIFKDNNNNFLMSLQLNYQKSGKDPVYFTVFMNEKVVKYGLSAVRKSFIEDLVIDGCNTNKVLYSEIGRKYKLAFDEISECSYDYFDKTKHALLSYVKANIDKQIDDVDKEIEAWL